MLIEFESAVLSTVPATEKSQVKIGWFVQSTDVGAASVRYRCFHFARVLPPEFHSQYLTSLAEARAAMPTLDAIIVVKRLDRAVVELVGLARLFAVPVFLDLCDDLVANSYPKNDHGLNLLHFLGVAPLLAGVVVPSAVMAGRVEAYAADHHLSGLSVHVVPDVAE